MSKKKILELQKLLRDAGIKHHILYDAMGMGESTFRNKLRRGTKDYPNTTYTYTFTEDEFTKMKEILKGISVQIKEAANKL